MTPVKRKKLSPAEVHLIRLAAKDAKEDGWARVSAAVWPFIASLPDDLIEREQFADGSGRVSLTVRGEAIADYC